MKCFGYLLQSRGQGFLHIHNLRDTLRQISQEYSVLGSQQCYLVYLSFLREIVKSYNVSRSPL